MAREAGEARTRRRALRRLALVTASIALAIGALEGLLWWIAPIDVIGEGWRVRDTLEPAIAQSAYLPDDDLGYRPDLDHPHYAPTGTFCNDYALEKRPGVQRVLFIGDSVTERHKIIDALRALYGEGDFEFWNAGVTGYNTVQEVLYYERYNASIEPDHVVLTFHNNDFRATPVAVTNDNGSFSVLDPDRDVGDISPWLLRTSQLYRRYVRMRLTEGDGDDLTRRVRATRDALQRLQTRLRRDGIELSVVLFPILRPRDQWTPAELESRRLALELFEQLGLRSFDLLDAMRAAHEEGLDLCESPGDSWHPNSVAARRFAAALRDQGLLRAERPPPRAPLLTADVASISLRMGGVQTLCLDAGPTHAGRTYLVLGSSSGTSPPTELGAVQLPLADDDYLQLTLAHPDTWIEGASGVLDAAGQARARLRIPAGAPAARAGETLWHAFVVLKPVPLTFYAGSNAVSLELTE